MKIDYTDNKEVTKMFCPKCGKQIEENTAKCPACGCEIEQVKNMLNGNEKTENKQLQNQNANVKNNTPIIIVSLICVTLVIIVSIVVYFMLNYKKNDNNNNANAVITTITADSRNEVSSTPTESVSSVTKAATTTTKKSTTKKATTTKKKTTTVTTTARPELSTKDLTTITESELVGKYFNGTYSTELISAGQYNVIALKNTSRLPYYKFGFFYMNADEIKGNDTPTVVQSIPGGQLTGGGKVGMTYNELKAIYNFDGAQFDGGTYGITAWTYIDGVKWGFEFELSQQDNADFRARSSNSLTPVTFDLSDINPKSSLAYYVADY